MLIMNCLHQYIYWNLKLGKYSQKERKIQSRGTINSVGIPTSVIIKVINFITAFAKAISLTICNKILFN